MGGSVENEGPPAPEVRGVLFDFGGTLVGHSTPWTGVRPQAVRSAYEALKKRGLRAPYGDFERINAAAFEKAKEVGSARGRDIPDRSTYIEVVGALFPGRSGVWKARTATLSRNAFWSVMAGNYALKPHALLALRKLKALEMRLGVVSNFSDSDALEGVLHRLKISRFLSKVVVSSEAGLRKPDPRIFRECLASLRLRPENALFVGNSPIYDVAGAKGAGLRAVHVPGDEPEDQAGPGAGPDFSVSDLLEVPEIVSSLNGGRAYRPRTLASGSSLPSQETDREISPP